MKVVFVTAAADMSGGARVIAIYAERLAARGHEVSIITRPNRQYTLREKARTWLRGQKLHNNKPYGPSHYDNLKNVNVVRVNEYRAINANDVPDADVVIATWWETAEWVAALPPRKGAKAYFIQHYEIHVNQDATRVNATWRLPLHKIIIAHWLVELAKLKFEDTDISLVPNAVDFKQFTAPPRSKQPVPTVGLMYSTTEFKGCDISLTAIELVRQKLHNLKLVAFGHAEPSPQLPLPKYSEFTLLPPQDKIKDVYAKCDVWIVGSRSEGFGLPILEAMACRTPVVATHTGAAPELTAPGGGALVPIEDPRTMAKEIERILKLPTDQWRHMSDVAYTTATRYSWDDATDLFEAALKTAIQKAG